LKPLEASVVISVKPETGFQKPEAEAADEKAGRTAEPRRSRCGAFGSMSRSRETGATDVAVPEVRTT
jgi:hypothetical protein